MDSMEHMIFSKVQSQNKYSKVPTQGTDYYVNGITGDDAKSGLSWGAALKTLEEAIDRSETLRLSRAATNQYIRNRIFVAPKSTPYAALVVLPWHCDIIGCGAVPYGNGAGIVIIGADGADGISDASNLVAGTRGLGLYRLQFRSGGAFACAKFANLYRSEIEDCAFEANTHAANFGLQFVGAAGGLVIRRCIIKGSGDVIPVVGLKASGTHLNESLIEYNILAGTTSGVKIDNTVKNGDQTVFRGNSIGDMGKGCAIAIDDDQPADTVGYIRYDGNFLAGTVHATAAQKHDTRFVGNFGAAAANGFATITNS